MKLPSLILRLISCVAFFSCTGSQQSSSKVNAPQRPAPTSTTVDDVRAIPTPLPPALIPTATPAGGAPGPETGRRLTNGEFGNLMMDALEVHLGPLADELPSDPDIEGFTNALEGLRPSDLRTGVMATLAADIAARALGTPEALLNQIGDSCPFDTAGCRSKFFDTIARRLVRRRLNSDERARFESIFDLSRVEGDSFLMGARLALQALIQSPEALYRLEKPRADDNRVGAKDFAVRMAFLIWASGPDLILMEAAETGELESADQINAQIDRLLADPRARRGGLAFASDWLDLDRLDRVARDLNRFGGFGPALKRAMRGEAERLFERVAFSENLDLRKLLTHKVTEATPALALIYGLPPRGTDFEPYDLTANPNRLGILTQPGILTMTAPDNTGASIIDRGLYIMGKLLCEHLPSPPAGVPVLDDAVGGSSRDRLRMHAKAPACAACHSRIDPLGYATERFDPMGRYRTADESGWPLLGTGSLLLDGETNSFANIDGFARLLATSPSVSTCLVQQVLHYAFGRALGSQDKPLSQAMLDAFIVGGQRWGPLLKAIAHSPAFSHYTANAPLAGVAP